MEKKSIPVAIQAVEENKPSGFAFVSCDIAGSSSAISANDFPPEKEIDKSSVKTGCKNPVFQGSSVFFAEELPQPK